MNMSHKMSRISALVVCLLVYFLIINGSLQGSIVCVRLDGQVEIKASCNCHKSPFQGTASKSASRIPSMLEWTSSKDLCGPCVDIPVLIGAITPTVSRRNNSFHIKLLISKAIASTLPVFIEIETACTLLILLPTFSSILPSLQTMVLLC